MTGFAVFFSIFELTRRAAASVKDCTVNAMSTRWEDEKLAKSQIPRVVHGSALVGGGVLAGLAYEMVGRPWDVARRAVHLQAISNTGTSTLHVFRTLVAKAEKDGILSFFRVPSAISLESGPVSNVSALRRRLFSALRVLGRVGPWGAGFLIWEAFGPGLAP